MNKRKEKGKVDVNAVLGFKFLSGLDTLISRGNLDQDAILVDSLLLVKVNDFQSLLDGGFLVEGKSCIDLSRNTTGNDVENLGTELDQEVVKGLFCLFSFRARNALCSRDGFVNQLGVFSLLEAARMRDGLVVASWGLYLAMATRVLEKLVHLMMILNGSIDGDDDSEWFN